MTHSTSIDNKKKSFILSTLGTVLFFYVFFSFVRFFIYEESILSKEPTVILMAIVIAFFTKVTTWIKSFCKLDRNEKKHRYFLFPISSAIITYLVISFIRYVILQDTILTKNLEVIIFAVMIGVFEGVGAKIHDISPRDPKKEPTKPLRHYIDKFVIHATPFHKVMFVVYGVCILFLLLMVWLMI